MKVGYTQGIFFRGITPNKNTSKEQNINNKKEIKELNYVTPDFAVKTPQSYKKLNEYKLDNGLVIHTYKLANGHKVSIIPMENSPAIVKNYVNVGSMNETQNIKGISHFLEHMAFNGTNGSDGHIKLEVGDSFKKIEELGGWANASTNYAKTDFVNSTQQLNKNDIEQQIKVIAAMTEDLKLSEEMIEKEKYPVCSEINMILDDPQTIAMDQTVRTLFSVKNPTDELVGGSVKSIQDLTKKDLENYYNKYYTPDNMNLVITGDVKPDEIIDIVSKNFTSKKISIGNKFEEKLTPITKTVRKDFRNDKSTSCDIVIGFAGPRNNEVRDNIVFKLANLYLNSYSSGLRDDLKKMNTYPDIGKDKISTNLNAPQITYIAANTSEKNSEKVLQTIFNDIANLEVPDEKTLKVLKDRLLKAKDNSMEYSSFVNNLVGEAILDNRLEGVTNFENILETITAEEVYSAVKKYFDINKAAVTVIHPTKNNNITFEGKRSPINEDKITELTLDNNYNIGFYKSQNNNVEYNISLNLDRPYNKKAGVIEILDLIYTMGTANQNEKDYKKYKQMNNIKVSAQANSSFLDIHTNSSYNNRDLIFKNAKELLYNPNITEENINKAKEIIKDSIEKEQTTASQLYQNFYAKNSELYFSEKEILDNLDNISINDVKECHQYLLENSRGIITANIPENKPEIKNEIINTSKTLNKVKENIPQITNIYKANQKAVVLQKANKNSQADIMQVNSFKIKNTIKDNVVATLTNSILSNSSIGLFENLREKEHLAYSVYSEYKKDNNEGTISCNILTTTDNKEINDTPYENLQKSIKGFNKQIELLKAGDFTEQDLNNAKLGLKSGLLDNEGTANKLSSIEQGLNSIYGINYLNETYKEIDKITKKDIIEFAQNAFKNPPIYSIVASKDTLDYNKVFLESLENDSKNTTSYTNI